MRRYLTDENKVTCSCKSTYLEFMGNSITAEHWISMELRCRSCGANWLLEFLAAPQSGVVQVNMLGGR